MNLEARTCRRALTANRTSASRFDALRTSLLCCNAQSEGPSEEFMLLNEVDSLLAGTVCAPDGARRRETAVTRGGMTRRLDAGAVRSCPRRRVDTKLGTFTPKPSRNLLNNARQAYHAVPRSLVVESE